MTLNTLTNGAQITISGQNSYNGTYTITNKTGTSFDIAKTFVTGTETQTGVWNLAGGMITGCFTTATKGSLTAINLANVPSRFTGVAPLSVFFDASSTTTDSSVTTKPFHDIEYRWNFGEDPTALAALPGGTNWTNGSTKGSRNVATGPVAAHVFETPGVYTVTVTATDGTNTVANSCVQIVVQNSDTVFADSNTICVSTGIDFTGCPTGAITETQASFPAAISSYAKTGKRVLFKRGDTFIAPTQSDLGGTGPGTIGSFGSGALPIISATANNTILRMSNQASPGISDWRVMDLTLDGASGTSTIGVWSEGTIHNVTLLRLNIINTHDGIAFAGSLLDWANANRPQFGVHTMWNGITIADSTCTKIVGGGGGYCYAMTAAHFALLGSFADNQLGGEGTTRFPTLVKAVISNNTFAGPGPTKEVIKLHATSWCNSGTTPGCNYTNDSIPTGTVGVDGINTFGYSEKIIISDNKLIAAVNNPWMVTIGPQDGFDDERVRDLIFERNWAVAAANTQSSILVMARNVSVRNNICDLSPAGSGGGSCFAVGVWGVEPPSDNVWVYNNTAYSSSSAILRMVALNVKTTNITVKNNLGYAPANSGSVMFDGSSGAGFVSANNSLDAQIKNTSPNFATNPASIPADFKITTGSYAIGAGAVVPVWSDFFSVPQTTTRDMGAVIH